MLTFFGRLAHVVGHDRAAHRAKPILAAMSSEAADPVAIIGASGALGFGLALRFGRAGVPW